ncbi:hypothetical protein NBRC10513v2_006518 [Rhodotorula toruloides]
MSAMNRVSSRVSFSRTSSANAFRAGVREVVSQAWWTTNLGRVEDKPCAQLLRDRLEQDELAVGKVWLQQYEQSDQPPPPQQVFGETVLGAAVYTVIVGLGLDEKEMMRALGNIYGTLLQSIAIKDHMFDIAIRNLMSEAPAGFSYINGELMSTYTRYLVAPIAGIVDGSQNPHVFAPTSLAHTFCEGVEVAFSKHDWDKLGVPSHVIHERLQADHAKVTAVPGHQLTDKVLFTLLLGTAVCEAIPPNSNGNVLKLGKVYGALLKSIAYPGHVIHGPGGFSYHAGQPMSTSHELARRQPPAAHSSVFFPLSRKQSGARW